MPARRKNPPMPVPPYPLYDGWVDGGERIVRVRYWRHEDYPPTTKLPIWSGSGETLGLRIAQTVLRDFFAAVPDARPPPFGDAPFRAADAYAAALLAAEPRLGTNRCWRLTRRQIMEALG